MDADFCKLCRRIFLGMILAVSTPALAVAETDPADAETDLADAEFANEVVARLLEHPLILTTRETESPGRFCVPNVSPARCANIVTDHCL